MMRHIFTCSICGAGYTPTELTLCHLQVSLCVSRIVTKCKEGHYFTVIQGKKVPEGWSPFDQGDGSGAGSFTELWEIIKPETPHWTHKFCEVCGVSVYDEVHIEQDEKYWCFMHNPEQPGQSMLNSYTR